MYPERYVSQMQDTCGIHAGYMYPQRSSRYMWDTCGIHAGYMYLKCIQREMYLIRRRHAGYMQDSFGIHARYMYPQWQSRYNRDTFRIHARYMIVHAGYMRDTCGKRVSGGWGNVWMPSWRAAHPSGHPCQPCAEVGLLQHPPALLSSALSWPPLSLLVYRPGRARSAPTSPAAL